MLLLLPLLQAVEQPLLLDWVVQEETVSAVGDSSAFFLFEERIR